MSEPKLKRALSIRQPYAEQILQGIKKFEYRSQKTNIRERVYIYAAQTPGPDEEFARLKKKPGDLPTGVLAGTVEIVDCTGVKGDYKWHLARPKRLKKLIKPERRPQPSFFFPFEESK